MMMPPAAFSCITSISTVGVVDKPRSMTSAPNAVSVSATNFEIEGPLILPSLPMTIFLLPLDKANCPYAEVNFTTSMGDKDSPGFPPIVPLIPDMLLISATIQF